VETLSLAGSSRASFAVPLEWTDQGPPAASPDLGEGTPTLDVRSLVALGVLLEHLDLSAKKEVDNAGR